MKKIDLTNKIINKWHILYQDKKVNRIYYWKCRCMCGREFSIPTSKLINNKSKGCKFCKNNKGKRHKQWAGYGEISLGFWNDIKNGAIGKKSKYIKIKKFDITIQYAWNLFLKQNKKCALSGEHLTFNYRRKHGIEHTASLDRIDSNKGYIEGNVQWVHKDINKMKNIFDQRYFIDMCHKISNYSLEQQYEKECQTADIK